MPELPEVETIRRELAKAIKNKTIADFWSDWPKGVNPKPAGLRRKIKGKKIVSVGRRAKILIIKLSSGEFLIIHLKLTGQLVYKVKETLRQTQGDKARLIVGGHPQKGGLGNLPNKFTHYIFSFADGSKLFFNDLRKFGWVRLVSQAAIDKLISSIGVEPFDKEFTLNNFSGIIKKYQSRKIKQVLLDQSLISGLGNIYTDESCFCAKILPTRVVKTLKEAEIKSLFVCIPKILRLAIAKKGTSDNTYVQLDGRPGGMVPYLNVYGRKGEKCKRCGGSVQKIKLNGRGTHFCKNCQK